MRLLGGEDAQEALLSLALDRSRVVARFAKCADHSGNPVVARANLPILEHNTAGQAAASSEAAPRDEGHVLASFERTGDPLNQLDCLIRRL